MILKLFLVSAVLVLIVFAYCRYAANSGKGENEIRIALIALVVGLFALWGWYNWNYMSPERVSARKAIEEQEEIAARGGNCNNDIMAYVVGQDFVRDRLKAPSSADFPRINEAVVELQANCQFSIISYVEAINSFGAKLRTPYVLTLKYLPVEDKWQLISLEM